MQELTVKEHLQEVKKRLLIITIAFTIIFLIVFFASNIIIKFIINYFQLELILLTPLEYLKTQLKISLYLTLLINIPIILNQIYQFIRPIIQVKTNIIKNFIVSIILSITGLVLGFTIFTDVTLKFFQNIPANLTNQWSLLATMNLIIFITISLAIIFQIILIIPLLNKWKILKINFMRNTRKYILITVITLSAIITPTTDPITLMLFAVPTYLCFEIGNLIGIINYKKNKENEQIC